MSKTIQFSYTWDKKSFLESSYEAYKYEMKHSPKRFLGWIFIAMTQFGVVAAFKGAPIGLLLVSTLLVGYWYFFRWRLRKSMLSKTFDKNPNLSQTYNVAVNDRAIDINGSLIDWSDIKEVVSLKKGFLILSNNSFFFFPKNAFKDIEERNEFASLAKSKVSNYTKD
jgi:hypothetical protein